MPVAVEEAEVLLRGRGRVRVRVEVLQRSKQGVSKGVERYHVLRRHATQFPRCWIPPTQANPRHGVVCYATYLQRDALAGAQAELAAVEAILARVAC